MPQSGPDKVSAAKAKLSLLRRSGTSVNQQGRTRRTHLPGLESFIKKLSLEERMKRNGDIEQANEKRREKHALYVAKLDTTDTSPVASLYSVTSDEWEAIRRNKTIFDRVKTFIPTKFLAWITEMDEAESQSRKSTGSAQPAVPAAAKQNSYLMEPIVERDIDPTKPTNIDFPDQLYPMAKYHRYLPLPLFTDTNLLFIKNNIAQFRTEKILLPNADPNVTEKTTILLLADIKDKLRIDSSRDDSDEGLSFFKFQQAASNYFRFELSRDPQGAQGNRASWTQNHMLFWTNRPEAEETYPLWKPLELEMRRDRQDMDRKFTLHSYELAWIRIQTAIDAKKVSAS